MSKQIFNAMVENTGVTIPGKIAAQILREEEAEEFTPEQITAFEEEIKRLGSPVWSDVSARYRLQILKARVMYYRRPEEELSAPFAYYTNCKEGKQ